ncbi:MAG: thiamine pyrophosphate-binding protein [Myxococcota bacterium]|nr:thiamine pyrophosphate-binding protein [Myxococcota bacterium]
MQLADALVEALKGLGVRYVFGVSGANIEHFHDAIHRLGGDSLRSVLAKSEDGAAFMADCHARVHASLAVCASTSGGGMMNLVAGLAESYQSSTPVLAIVGQPPRSLHGRGAFQDSSGVGRTVRAVQLLGSLTKFVAELERSEDFWASLERAIIEATSGRQGPSALLIPRDLYAAEVGPPPSGFFERLKPKPPPRPADTTPYERMLRMLRAARRPMLLVGQGVRRSSNADAVRMFADHTRIPVATTMSARGGYPNDAPNYLGVLGAAGHPSVQEYVSNVADLILVVGASLNAMTSAPLAKSQHGLSGKEIVAIGQDLAGVSRALGSRAEIALGIEGDAGVTFEILNELWARAPFVVANADYEHLAFSPSLAPAVSPRRHAESELLQSEALRVLERHLPEAGHILYDAGNCAAAALHYVKVPRNVTATIALGMGGMGYAIGGAVGAQLGSPAGTRSLVFTGDGAFLMSGFEVHTAVELGLPILFVVFNNSMHGMCVTRQQLYFDARIESSTYGYVDVATVARGLGSEERLWVAKATTADDLDALLKAYARRGYGPGVIEVVTAREEIPPFSPFLSANARTQRRPSRPPRRPALGNSVGAGGTDSQRLRK